MFGLKHIKFDSMTYVMHYKMVKFSRRGVDYHSLFFPQIVRLLPSQWEVMIYLYFNETTSDYQQEVTIQGQISYKVSDPKVLADNLGLYGNR